MGLGQMMESLKGQTELRCEELKTGSHWRFLRREVVLLK